MVNNSYNKQQKISVVIAAYNEEPRIAKVLEIVEHHQLIDEVIVVNDGSKDDTSKVIKKFAVRLIENEKNMGKTLSVKRGIEAAKNDLIMLLDADLKGLNADSITALSKPVLDGKVDWTLSLRGNSVWYMKLLKMDWVSGERVIPKSLLLDPLIWSHPNIGYGLETLMNKSLLCKDTAFCSVYLPQVIVINKSGKVGFVKGWIGELKMMNQISKVIPFHELLMQLFKMSAQNRKVLQDINNK